MQESFSTYKKQQRLKHSGVGEGNKIGFVWEKEWIQNKTE